VRPLEAEFFSELFSGGESRYNSALLEGARTMRRINGLFAIAAVAACVPWLAGCEQHSASEKYYLVSANIKLPYWQQAGDGFTDAAKVVGVKAEMVGPGTFNPQDEVTEFRQAVSKKPAGILVSVTDPKLLQPEIDSAIAAGIPVITMDADAPDSKRLFFIGTNNLQAGRLGGQTLVQKLNGHGNVVFFTMPGQVNMDERLKGYMDVLGTKPGIRVVEVVDIHGDSRVAFDKTEGYVSKTGADKIDAFVCLEASSGKDVASAVKRGNVTGRTIIAMDTDADTLKLVQDGTIAATIAQKPYTMGYFGLRQLADIKTEKAPQLGGNYSADPTSPYPVFVDTGTSIVDQTNVEQYLAKQK
jgi:ribose transport system substrate-binding protein